LPKLSQAHVVSLVVRWLLTGLYTVAHIYLMPADTTLSSPPLVLPRLFTQLDMGSASHVAHVEAT